MENPSKPSVFPVIRYNDARAAIDWLVRAFGFEKHAEYAGPGGTIAHAEVGNDTGVVGISSATPPVAGNVWSTVRQGVYVHVDDPDPHLERANAAGAAIVAPLEDQEYGSREYSVRDPEGYLWGFGTYDMGGRTGDVVFVPELRYRDAPNAVKWLATALGFEPSFETRGPDGALVHAELRFGDGAVYAGPMLEGGAFSDVKQFVNVVVDDPDRHCARAKAAGANIVVALQDAPYGARFYAARDPEGFLWWLSTYKPARAD